MHTRRQCRFRSPCSAAASCVGSVHSLKELGLRAEMVGNPKLSQIFSHMDKEGNGRCTRAPSCCRFPPLYRPFRPLPAISALVPPIPGRKSAVRGRKWPAEGGMGGTTGGKRSHGKWAVQRRKSAVRGRKCPARGGTTAEIGGNAQPRAEMDGTTAEISGTRASTKTCITKPRHRPSESPHLRGLPQAPRPLVVLPSHSSGCSPHGKPNQKSFASVCSQHPSTMLKPAPRPILRSWTPQGPIKILAEASVHLQASDIMRETTTETVATRPKLSQC